MEQINKNQNSENEKQRLEALESYQIMDTEEEEDLNALTKLASYICQTPIALISLVDGRRQWFKAALGLNAKETEKSISFCQYTILDDKPFEVLDTQNDERFLNNPLVKGYPAIRYYRGSPLITPEGFSLGSFCVIDTVPRVLTEEQKDALDILSKEVVVRFELRKKIRQEAKEKERIIKAEQYSSSLMENSQGLICTHDMDGIILSVNPAAATSLQSSKEELIGKSLYDIIDQKVKRLLGDYLIEIKSNRVVSGIMQVVTNKGEHRYWEYRNIRMDEPGKSSYVIGFSQDMTEHIIFEKKLKKAIERAEEATKIKDQFLANMSHEIRTPINAIMGFSKFLLTTPNHKNQKEFIEAINTSSVNLLSIINDILDMAKIEEGKITFEETELDLESVLQSIKIMLKGKVDEKGLQLISKIDTSIPKCLIGDSVKLNQILLNLIGNAIKFTEKGKITVDVFLVDTKDQIVTLAFKIKDTGIGISKQNQATIFERFVQENTSTTRLYGGAGLGLSITKKLIELQGGFISVESQLNKGTIFTFQLPFKYIKGKIKIGKEILKIGKRKNENAKILVVEDHLINQRLVLAVLEERGYIVDVASNGKEAIKMLQAKQYDVVLMDIQMPIMDGYKTTVYIRNQLAAPLNAIPIIALTAHASGAEAQKCKSIGMNDYLSKPFDTDVLCERIMKCVKANGEKSVKQKSVKSKKELKGKYTNLDYLRKASFGKDAFVIEMITLFLKESPALIKRTKVQLKKENWTEVQKNVHKLKTSFIMMGSSNGALMATKIEMYSKSEKNRKQIPLLIGVLEEEYFNVEGELKLTLVQLKKDRSLQ